jgi:uncharacterized protein YbbC (DUF1343 family)
LPLSTAIQIGLERLQAEPPAWLRGRRLGLLSNPASVDARFHHARQLITHAYPGQLRALFSPQHGFYAEKQDNMVESPDMTDNLLQIPVFSLYAQTRKPTPSMLADIDVLVVDLQDVGTRVYTFIYTLSYCMEAVAEQGKTLLVLDRPNPLNGCTLEGNCLAAPWRSFVGRFALPMRHGLTIAELARFFNDSGGIGCDLHIIPMRGWQRTMDFPATGRSWVAPSPNMPSPGCALVYPGQVIWEGTNLSEGRGTTQPFEICGAPYIDPEGLLRELDGDRLEGVVLRPLAFEPTSGKWAGQRCYGVQLHVTDPSRFRPYRTSLRLLQTVIRNHGGDFAWRPPPYEYEYEHLPIDLIIGDGTIRRRVEALEPLEAIEADWGGDLRAFADQVRSYHLYQLD